MRGTLADIIPGQDRYYLLTDGTSYARHGTEDANGLLVFSILERAEQCCMTLAKNTAFFPVRVSGHEFLELAVKYGSICVAEGRNVTIATLRTTPFE